ncbi:hypothetical protein CV770_29100 [Bradyrhizobium sp. AC87j1]|nr:hypothetical protein CV770_29100 [Bradyrhizobium sp. AC87j1]
MRPLRACELLQRVEAGLLLAVRRRIELVQRKFAPLAKQRAGRSTTKDVVDYHQLSGRMSSCRCRSLATVCARSDAVISGINDQQGRRMYPCLLILNGPDVQPSGPLP